MSLVDDVTPRLVAADQQIADLTVRTDAQAASIATLTSTNAALTAQVADLTARLAAATAPPPPSNGFTTLPTGWTKVLYGDDFNAPAVNTTTWNVRNNTTQSNMDGRNFARNVSIKDSVLSIRSGADTGDTAKPWSCGYLDTNGKVEFAEGRWEARLRFPWGPTAAGFWPAFWLRPADGGIGEMDIMEAWAAKNDVHQTLWRDYTGTPHVEGKHQVIPPFDPTVWHTYAVEKENGPLDAQGKPTVKTLRFLVDDVVVWDAKASASWTGEALGRNVKWAIRLNLQMGGSYGGKPTAATDLSQTFDVDWVRVLGR